MVISKSIESLNYRDLTECQFTISNECPNCHFTITPHELNFYTYKDNDNNKFACFTFVCLNCYQPYVAWFSVNISKNQGHYKATSKLLSLGPKSIQNKSFSNHIESLSPNFVKIYNESLSAETLNLTEICGIGYRKALEFLIKDYLIYKTPSDAEKIKSETLSSCINNRVNNNNVKNVAKRCAWLGNDQTHYIKKHEDKDINDLKKILEATVAWIELELITEEILKIEPIK